MANSTPLVILIRSITLPKVPCPDQPFIKSNIYLIKHSKKFLPLESNSILALIIFVVDFF